MKYARTFLLVCALGLLLVNGPARAQNSTKPKVPICGSWDVVPSPNPNGNGYLTAVASVPGSTEVWSVGVYNASYHWLTLIEHWDGTSWQVVQSPNIAGADHYLQDVFALAHDDVWAVGRYDAQGGGTRTLTMHWDGTTWTIVPSPNPTVYNQLWSVAGVSSKDVWAVGYHFVSSPAQETLILHWDGTAWSVVPSPNVGTHDNLLNKVTTVPDPMANIELAPVWAAGYYYRDDGNPSTLTLRWDGSAWVVVPSPDASTRENYLSGLGGTGRGDLWSTGVYNRPDGLYLPLTEHWNGEAWSVVQAQSVSSSYTVLSSVAPISERDVWAVGTYFNDNAAQLTLAEHWDGTSWQMAYTPNPAGEIDNTRVNVLNSAVSVPKVGVWAVGYYQIHGTQAQTLIEFYCSGSRKY